VMVLELLTGTVLGTILTVGQKANYAEASTTLEHVTDSTASEWGTIMYPKANTNIRANRSAASKLEGQLKTDQPVKVDFLKDDWYAVFPMTQAERNEKKALGYIYAPLLVDKLNATIPASDWGRIMYPKPNANIRANRSAASKLEGQLKTDQPIKVDFLQDDWYAVFPMTQTERNEKKALGYIYAPLLVDKLNTTIPTSEWGTIMYPKANTNIRANRSAESKLEGQLKTDQPVKVDFLQDDWYAVFPMTQTERNEKKALGYVYASLLVDKLNATIPTSEWGTIMYPKPNTNIRANRSSASKLEGQLKTDEPVKVDFLQDDWYAVFPVTQAERIEKQALGYVYAPLLVDKQEHNSFGSTASEEKSAQDAPRKKIETESLAVDVKDIAFKATVDGKELLFIEFDRFYKPTISRIEGEKPRIVLEIKNASALKKDWSAINTGGNFIRKIRSRLDTKTRTARIVLDMAPEYDYFINQAFYKTDNMYSLEISDKK